MEAKIKVNEIDSVLLGPEVRILGQNELCDRARSRDLGSRLKKVWSCLCRWLDRCPESDYKYWQRIEYGFFDERPRTYHDHSNRCFYIR